MVLCVSRYFGEEIENILVFVCLVVTLFLWFRLVVICVKAAEHCQYIIGDHVGCSALILL